MLIFRHFRALFFSSYCVVNTGSRVDTPNLEMDPDSLLKIGLLSLFLLILIHQLKNVTDPQSLGQKKKKMSKAGLGCHITFFALLLLIIELKFDFEL